MDEKIKMRTRRELEKRWECDDRWQTGRQAGQVEFPMRSNNSRA